VAPELLLKADTDPHTDIRPATITKPSEKDVLVKRQRFISFAIKRTGLWLRYQRKKNFPAHALYEALHFFTQDKNDEKFTFLQIYFCRPRPGNSRATILPTGRISGSLAPFG
jgi:hypothetical protein